MNFGSIVQGAKNLGQGAVDYAKNVGSNLRSGLVTSANGLERMVGGNGTKSASLASLLGMKANPLAQSQPTISKMPSAASQFVSGLPTGIVNSAFGVSPALSDQFQSSRMVAAQTPQASSPTISPAALNASQPGSQRTGNAYVPTPPATSNSGLSSQMAPQASAPTPSFSSTSFSSSPSSGFAAAVPMAAILAQLAQRPDSSTAGYVATPESIQLGSRPWRKDKINPRF